MKTISAFFALLTTCIAISLNGQNAPVSTIGTISTSAETATVPVTAFNFNNMGACDMRILYDQSIATATSVTMGSGVTGNIDVNLSTPGVIRLGWYTSPCLTLTGSSVIFNCTFAKVKSGTTNLIFDYVHDDGYSCQFYCGSTEYEDDPHGSYYVNGSLRFSSGTESPVTTAPVVKACPGTEISIPITVTGFNNIGAVNLIMNYDASVLSFISGTNTGGFTGLSPVNGSIPGIIVIGGNNTLTEGYTITNGDTLVTLKFNYLGGTTALTWDDDPAGNCEYAGPTPTFTVLNDIPQANFYIPGSVSPAENANAGSVTGTSPLCIGATANYTSSGNTGGTWSSTTPATASVDPTSGIVTTLAAGITNITYTVSSGCGAPKSSFKELLVSPASLGGTAVAVSSTVCSGSNTTITLAGYTGVIRWQQSPDGSTGWTDVTSGSGGTTSTYTTPNLTTNTYFRAAVTSGSCSVAWSNVVMVTVNPTLPVSISIATNSNPVCSGTSVTFTATPTNGGTTPAYQWKVNGVNAGTNSPTYSYTPVNGDAVTCILTSSITCATGNPATSNTVTMVVNPTLPVGVNIAANANPVCTGTSVTFTATPTNGGTTPAYQWKVNGTNVGTNNPAYSYIPLNGDAVTCVLTSGVSCAAGNPATSNPMIITVNPTLLVGVNIAASANPVCTGTSVTFTATPTNGGTTPAYQWKVNGTNVGTNNPAYSYIPLNGDAVTCVLTSGVSCAAGNPATSNPMIITVNPTLLVGVNIAASANPVCTGTSVTFTATPTNGGTTPAYQWKVNGTNVGTNSPTYSYTPVNGDAVTCVLTSSVSCTTGNPASSNPMIMTVNPSLPVGVNIAANANPVCTGTSVTFTATPTNGGTTPAYQWKVNGTNVGTNSPTYSYTPVNGDAVTCVLTSVVSCAPGNPATSNPMIITVNPTLPVSVNIAASANPVCTGTSVTFTATPTNGGITPAYQWKINGINAGTNSPTYSYTPVNGDAVTCVLTSSVSCATGNPATSNPMTITVNPTLPVSISIAASANPVCTGTSVTFTATPANGGTTPAYQWNVNGTNVGTNSPAYSYTPVNGDAVTCVLTSNVSCATGNPATSNPMIITVNPTLQVSVNIAASANPVCTGTSVTFTATPTNGGTTPVYQWKVNGVNAGTNSPTYSYTPVNGDAVTCVLTSNVNCINEVIISAALIMEVKECTAVEMNNSDHADCILLAIYPNPFTCKANIEYTLPENGNINIEITDITGNNLKLLSTKQQIKGRYVLDFDGNALAPGIYLITLMLEKQIGVMMKTILIIKQ